MEKITKHQAITRGLTRYYTGKPCKRGHYSERLLGGACVACKKEYQSTEGYKSLKRKWDGSEKNKAAHKIRNKRYKDKNRDEIRKKSREYSKIPEVKERKRESAKRRLESGEERKRKSSPEYLAWRREYTKKRHKENPNAKLATSLRIRLLQAVKGKAKSGSAVKMLGCSVDEAREHLEAQFSVGMSWKNHGEWHIDHIKPLSWFDLSDPKQMAEACHYTNLQPLWGYENISKGNRAA